MTAVQITVIRKKRMHAVEDFEVIITTTTVLWPFVLDYPGEPVAEETFTHSPS